MKTTSLCLVLVAVVPALLTAAEVVPGATWAEVHAALGAPKGQLRRSDRQVLYYERGTVEFAAGRVTQVALRSPEEQALQDAREARLQAELAAQRARLVAEGTALRDRKLADAAFLAAPLAYQVSFWESFARSYPGVSCSEPLTVARLRYSEQLEERSRREAEAGRRAEIEERRLAAAEREPEFYPIRTYSSYYGRRTYREFGLGQISYRFNDSSLTPYTTPTGSPYTTPAGNPAGSLTGWSDQLPAVSSIPRESTIGCRGLPGRGAGRHPERL